jgi:hypothetical protein
LIVHECFSFNCWVFSVCIRAALSFVNRANVFLLRKAEIAVETRQDSAVFLNTIRLSLQSVVQFLDLCTQGGTALRAVPVIHFADM